MLAIRALRPQALGRRPLLSRRLYSSTPRLPLESLGVDRDLARAAHDELGVVEPTSVQKQLISAMLQPSPVHSKPDVLIRDRTGTGKSLGVLLAMLSVSLQRMRNPHLNKLPSANIASPWGVMIVPDRALAYQIHNWADRLLARIKSSSDVPSSLTDQLETARVLQALTNNMETTNVQNSLLQSRSPDIIVGTPARILECTQPSNTESAKLGLPLLSLDKVQMCAIDEIDHLIRAPSRFATIKEKLLRKKHPTAGMVLATKLFTGIDLTQQKAADTVTTPASGFKRPQLIASSATLNNPLRHHLKKSGILDSKDQVPQIVIDETGGLQMSPETLTHHVLLITPSTVRNMPAIEALADTMDLDDVNGSAEQDIDNDSSGGEDDGKNVGLNEWICASPEEQTDAYADAVAQVCELEDIQCGLVLLHSNASPGDFVRMLSEDYGIPAEILTGQTSANSSDSDKTRRRIYVATEFTARGIDLPDLTHVIIATKPRDSTSYIHMSGRVARMGRQGKAITILPDTKSSTLKIRNIMRLNGIQPVPLEYVTN
ncbi:P-loop containing nucleoside triphosphate hydrolase protein [Ramicandelaber brevisporus]|nr:P-loop containing nucleoside triphosphate hydrolase protein [Ramicandelaber brevisporus]